MALFFKGVFEVLIIKSIIITALPFADAGFLSILKFVKNHLKNIFVFQANSYFYTSMSKAIVNTWFSFYFYFYFKKGTGNLLRLKNN